MPQEAIDLYRKPVWAGVVPSLCPTGEQLGRKVKASVDNAAEPAPANKKKRILLVEDDATSRLFLFNQLKKRGLETDTASNGGIALKKLKGGGFDAVIL